MDNSVIKNITIVLAILTLAFLGYYLFTMKDEISWSSGEVDSTKNLLADVQKYSERRQVLNQVKLDTSLFSDERFYSLRGYPSTIPTYQEGRNNPFANIEPR